ncbi:MAG: mobilization protein [Leptospiraceae bacterium]|nr:hypothetical protein [Leptospiraceae bacterium]MCP5501249.1 mobilization protein [Leptospiraceae bacterium]
MNIINFIGGEKGGVGKSVVSRLLAQYYIDNHISFIGYDTDRSHNTFLRFYENFASPTTVDKYESLDAIFENLDPDAENRIIVDLAAQTKLPLLKWMDESAVMEITEDMGISLKFWHVLDDSKDSTELLASLIDKFQDRLSYVIVKNYGRGSDFKIFESSNIIPKNLKADIIEIKSLHDTTMQKIDEQNMSFWAAINNKNNGLGVFEKQRIKTWVKHAFNEFASIGV